MLYVYKRPCLQYDKLHRYTMYEEDFGFSIILPDKAIEG